MTLAALAGIILPAQATTHTVDVGGGGEYTAIRTAAAFAAEGDTILVYPGTYTGADNRSIGANGTNLAFIAETGGRAPVIIDCEGLGRAFYLYQGEDSSTLIRGFTIQNGSDNSGGGMRLSNCSPIVEDCTFINNVTSQSGGAIYLMNSGATVLGCIFRGNSAESGGAAAGNVFSGLMAGCLFDENTATSGGIGGGAVYFYNSGATITLCTVVESEGDQVVLYDDTGTTISHCIIANGTEGISIAVMGTSSAFASRCVLFGNAGGDAPECAHDEIIYNDPLFCDDEADDYTLCNDSFAIDYNNAYHEQLGAYVSGCEPCGTPVEDATWGAVKALFR